MGNRKQPTPVPAGAVKPSPPPAPPRHLIRPDAILAVIVKDLRDLGIAWTDADVDVRNHLLAKWRETIKNEGA